MSEHQKQQSGSVIVATLLFAILLTIIPLPEWARYLRPEWVILVLIYWCMATPGRINVGIAWLMGMVVDVIHGNLLGQHALAFAIVAFVTVKLHRQIRVYPLWQQALSVFTLVALNQLFVIWTRGLIDQAPDTWLYWLPSFTSALIWPWLYLILRDLRRKFRVS